MQGPLLRLWPTALTWKLFGFQAERDVLRSILSYMFHKHTAQHTQALLHHEMELQSLPFDFALEIARAYEEIGRAHV